MTPRAPFLTLKINMLSFYTGTSGLPLFNVVELTLSFLTVPRWPPRSILPLRTINFPLRGSTTPTAPFSAHPLLEIHTSINIASTPPQQYQ